MNINLIERLRNTDGKWTAHYCKPHQIQELRDEAAAEIERLQSLADSMGQDNIELAKRIEGLQEIVLVKSREILALLEIIQRQIGLDCNKE
jgi:hypothetical protein